MVEVKGGSLILRIVAGVTGFERALCLSGGGRDGGGVDLQLVGVKDDGLGLFLDLEVYRYSALVGPVASARQVEGVEKDGVVGRLNTVKECLSANTIPQQ